MYVLNTMGPMTYERLGEVLWMIDSHAYVTTGESITGCKYYRES